MPDLIRLVHKSLRGVKNLVKTFQVHWGAKLASRAEPNSPSTAKETATVSPLTPKGPEDKLEEDKLVLVSGISKRKLEQKIASIAVKEIRHPYNRHRWFVHAAVLQQYGLTEEELSPLEVLGPTKETPVRSAESSVGRKGAKRPGGGGGCTPVVRTLEQFFLSPTQQKCDRGGVSQRLKLAPSPSPAKKPKLGVGKACTQPCTGEAEKPVIVIDGENSRESASGQENRPDNHTAKSRSSPLPIPPQKEQDRVGINWEHQLKANQGITVNIDVHC